MYFFLSFIEFILLILGVILPIAKIDEFWFFTSEFSILSIAKDLMINNEFFLAIIVISFGLIFPIVKIICRHTNIQFINRYNLHKFSMVDIFLISFLVFASKASSFFDMEILLGFYFLMASVLLGYFQIVFKKIIKINSTNNK
ncbi:MAG: paraquat-inducible protein A [Candidatus Puniceispirillales bacterium]